jgi:hypothetical protein
MEPQADCKLKNDDDDSLDEVKLLELFNRAWNELDPEAQRDERAERERWLAAYSNRD